MGLGLTVAIVVWVVCLNLRELAPLYLPAMVNARQPELGAWFATDLSGSPALLLSAIGVAWLFLLFWLAEPSGPASMAGIGLFTGGAAANTTERLMFGNVMDYIPVPGTGPVLANLADVAIAAGFLLFAVPVVWHHLARVIAARRR
jgi:hypothetical protein